MHPSLEHPRCPEVQRCIFRQFLVGKKQESFPERSEGSVKPHLGVLGGFRGILGGSGGFRMFRKVRGAPLPGAPAPSSGRTAQLHPAGTAGTAREHLEKHLGEKTSGGKQLEKNSWRKTAGEAAGAPREGETRSRQLSHPVPPLPAPARVWLNR